MGPHFDGLFIEDSEKQTHTHTLAHTAQVFYEHEYIDHECKHFKYNNK